MSSVKGPQQKKINAYQRDHRTVMEYPHAFRKNWPKKKARIIRRERRKLTDAVKSGDTDLSPAKLKTMKIRGQLRKSYVLTLGMKVNRQMDRRH